MDAGGRKAALGAFQHQIVDFSTSGILPEANQEPSGAPKRSRGFIMRVEDVSALARGMYYQTAVAVGERHAEAEINCLYSPGAGTYIIQNH